MENPMKLSYEQVKKLNEVAKENFEVAKGMLDMANSILGTKYGWLAKEVVWFDDPEKGYGSGVHSAIAWAE